MSGDARAKALYSIVEQCYARQRCGAAAYGDVKAGCGEVMFSKGKARRCVVGQRHGLVWQCAGVALMSPARQRLGDAL